MARAATKENVKDDMVTTLRAAAEEDRQKGLSAPTGMFLDDLAKAVMAIGYDPADEAAVNTLVLTRAVGNPDFSYDEVSNKVKLAEEV